MICEVGYYCKYGVKVRIQIDVAHIAAINEKPYLTLCVLSTLAQREHME